MGMRHELKHTISRSDDLLLASRLRRLFEHDEHADAHGVYRVRSLYFDDPADRAYCQKISGVDRREKFRIRCYSRDFSFIRLEKKYKINGLCAKKSARLSEEETRRIIEGDIGVLLEEENPLKTEFYSKLRGNLLRPKTVVEYEREAFRYPPGNVRITLDRDLRTGLGSTDFLNPNLLLIPATPYHGVLEVKYDDFLPDIVRRAVQLENRRASAFSKYAVCRRYD